MLWRPTPTSGTVDIAIDLPPPDLPAPPLSETSIFSMHKNQYYQYINN